VCRLSSIEQAMMGSALGEIMHDTGVSFQPSVGSGDRWVRAGAVDKCRFRSTRQLLLLACADGLLEVWHTANMCGMPYFDIVSSAARSVILPLCLKGPEASVFVKGEPLAVPDDSRIRCRFEHWQPLSAWPQGLLTFATGQRHLLDEVMAPVSPLIAYSSAG
jgi:hypothetical protein